MIGSSRGRTRLTNRPDVAGYVARDRDIAFPVRSDKLVAPEVDFMKRLTRAPHTPGSAQSRVTLPRRCNIPRLASHAPLRRLALQIAARHGTGFRVVPEGKRSRKLDLTRRRLSAAVESTIGAWLRTHLTHADASRSAESISHFFCFRHGEILVSRSRFTRGDSQLFHENARVSSFTKTGKRDVKVRSNEIVIATS